MKKLVIYVCTMVLLCLVSANAQTKTGQDLSSLDKYFTKYTLINLDFDHQLEKLSDRTSFHQIKLEIPNHGKQLIELTPVQIFADDYVRREATDNGFILSGIPDVYTFKGSVSEINDSKVSLTITPRMINGYIRIGKERYVFQSLSKYIDSAALEDVIVYNAKDSKDTHPALCGTETLNSQINHQAHSYKNRSADGDCYEVEIALASDFEMFEDYGSSNNVEDQIVGVLDDVQTNFDDEFADELLFELATTYIATSEGSDPWTNSTNAGTLLDDFSDWGNGGGFFVSYDVATLWTDRDLNGSTIGIAWLNAVCNDFLQHNVCQDFTGNSNLLRVLQAHELGHNFGAQHDSGGSGTIMAPSVNNTNTWSTNSMNQIENYYLNANCLSSCNTGPPVPSAGFTYDQDDECAPVEIQFYDFSNGQVDDYFWEFEGGDPATSTDENPVVTYYDEGTFDVSLTVSNISGSDEAFEANEIVIYDGTFADFDYSIEVDGTVVTFTDLSDNDVILWDWDFDDGNFSTDQNPVYDFVEDGEYYVELYVFNGECEDIYGTWITIATPPVADFSSDITEGCEPLVVEFENYSSNNTEDYLWEFEGGDPSFSNQFEPTVTYNEPGVYDVLLFVENDVGTNELLMTDYITVYAAPFADFNYIINGATAEFDNDSQFFNDVSWDFGDGNSSDEEEPVHVYDEDGTYTVTLTVFGDCGPDSFSQVITITSQASAAINQDTETGCLPLSVEFDGSSSYLSDTFDWTFEGATPSSSTAEIVTVEYDAIGQYDVTLIVTNTFSEDTLTIINAVTVNDAPVADYSVVNDELDFIFEAIPDGTYNTVYTWSLGDGTTAEGLLVEHSYDQEGIYEVNLTATNECGESTIVAEYNTYTTPMSNFMVDDRDGCLPHEVQYTSLASDNTVTHAWNFQGGTPSISNEINPVVVYDQAGTYTVSLEVSNPAGTNELVFQDYIIIRDVPQAGFSSQHDQTTINFNNSSIDATSYLWDFGDGNMSTEENPVNVYDDEGEYTVSLTAINECGESTITQTISVTLRPTASFAVNNSAGCAPIEVQYLDASSSNVESWNWTFPGGNPASSTDQNPIVTYDTPGLYSATLIVSGAGGADTISLAQVVEAYGLPTTEILSAVNLNEVQFNSSNTDVLVYDWDFGDGEISDLASPVHLFPENGTYLVLLTITDECGSSTVETEITINAYATAGFTADNDFGCPPFVVQFNQTASMAEEFLWSFPGGDPATSTEESVSVSYSEPGSYPVSLRASNSLGMDELILEAFITVGAEPLAAFDVTAVDGLITLIDMSEHASEYAWDFGDGTTSTIANPNHAYEESGTYTLSLTVSNECGTSTESRDITVDVPGIAFINSFEVYPNPNDGNFTAVIDAQGLGDFTYSIVDVLDRLVYSGEITVRASQKKYPLSHSDLAPATYILKLENEDQQLTLKMLVQ